MTSQRALMVWRASRSRFSVAADLRMTFSRYCAIESGTRLPSTSEAARIRDAAGIAVESWSPAALSAARRERAGIRPRDGAVRRAPIRVSEIDEKDFWSYVKVSDGCWAWTGGTNGADGYGMYYTDDHHVGAHRVSLMLTTGENPKRLALHSCDNPACVRPEHLRWGTFRENARDAAVRGRFHGDPAGERSGVARLSEDAVRDLRAHPPARGEIARIAQSLGVSTATVRNVLSGRTWRHVEVTS